MTTYTMNGHRHSTREIEPEIILGIARNQVAQSARARWQLRTLPERFRCLESADPKMQLQAALTQIEDLLQRNRKLLETVLLLSQALDDTYSINSAEHGAVYPTRRPLSSWKSTMMTAITIRR